MGEAIKELASSLDQAGGRQNKAWHDPGSHTLEGESAVNTWSSGSIQGEAEEGHEVSLMLGGKEQTGQLFDRPIEIRSDAYEELAKLAPEARPIRDEIRRSLFTSTQKTPVVERFKKSGSLDPGRLVAARFSEEIFQKHYVIEEASHTGKPVVAILCDASSSLSSDEEKSIKVISLAFFEATVKLRIKLMAGIYHSDMVGGVGAKLVQWLYHPQLTPSLTRAEAALSLMSLKKNGAQADALSLAYMLQQAERLAIGRENIYAQFSEHFPGIPEIERINEIFVKKRIDPRSYNP